MERILVRSLGDIRPVGTERPGIRDWLPLRAELGIDAFGVNVFVARETGDVLVEPHVEAGVSEHEELYVVLSGAARFDLGDEGAIELHTHDLLFIRDPGLRRSATATEPGTSVLVVGAPRGAPFTRTAWETRTLATYGRREPT